MTSLEVKDKLFQVGVRLATRFIKTNDVALPHFLRYTEADQAPEFARRMLRKVEHGQLVGTGTGLYAYGCVFVNVPVTALPAQQPRMRSWSYPGYKVDRTAVGVVAHEVGHHLERELQAQGRISFKQHGSAWRTLIQLYPKPVSGYEPVPSEAWAETVRLFILNPKLLAEGCPERYLFLRHEVGLQPAEQRSWRRVLLNNAAYIAAAERWIAK